MLSVSVFLVSHLPFSHITDMKYLTERSYVQHIQRDQHMFIENLEITCIIICVFVVFPSRCMNMTLWCVIGYWKSQLTMPASKSFNVIVSEMGITYKRNVSIYHIHTHCQNRNEPLCQQSHLKALKTIRYLSDESFIRAHTHRIGTQHTYTSWSLSLL